MNAYITFLGELGIPLMFFSFIGYCVIQVMAIQNLKGTWRIIAGLPVLVGIFVIVTTVIGGIQGSAQAPILLLLAGPPLFLYVAIVYGTYWVYTNHANKHP